MQTNAPPGMQQWVRDVDRRLGTVERTTKATSTPTVRRGPVYAEAAAAVQSPLTATGESWRRVVGANDLSITGSSEERRVKITVSAVCDFLRTDALPASASGIMRFSIQSDDSTMTSELADELGHVGLTYSLVCGNGAALPQVYCGSFSKIVSLPNGAYTVRSEYLYRQLSSNVIVRWSQRSLLIEPM